MRFEPADDFAADVDLDDLLAPELAALGEQLSADANHLAGRYPPRGESLQLVRPAAPRTQRPIRYGWRAFAAVAAACLAVGVTVALFPAPDRDAANHELARRSPPSPEATDTPAPASSLVPVVAPEHRPATRPALFDPELSGPELEAILDLLEPDPLASYSI